MKTKVRKIGNSLGVTLPKQLIQDLHLKRGDTLTIKKRGTKLELKPIDPEFEKWAQAYREASMEYKEVLKEFTK